MAQQPTFKNYADWLRHQIDAALDTAVGNLLNDRYWIVDERGGNCLTWQLMNSDERIMAWITVDEGFVIPEGFPAEFDDLGTNYTPEQAAQVEWACGLYDPEDSESDLQKTLPFEVITGLIPAMDWCEAQLKAFGGGEG